MCTLNVVVLLLFSVSVVAFDANSLAGLYRLQAGPTACADLLRFRESGTDIPASSIEQDERQCSGAVLHLNPDPGNHQNGLIDHLNNHPGRAGTVYAGKPTGLITCPNQSPDFTRRGTIFVFFTPKIDFQITLHDVLGVDRPLETATGSRIQKFKAGIAYILINNRCLFAFDRQNNDNGGGSSGSSSSSSSSGSSGNDNACFPANANAITPDGPVRMTHLQVGSLVRARGNDWTEVIAWTHRLPTSTHDGYVSLLAIPKIIKPPRGSSEINNDTTAFTALQLTVTPGHYVTMADGQVRRADDVHVGDELLTAHGVPAIVSDVLRNVAANGLYNPQTRSGEIVVNGLLATTYTDSVKASGAHALLAPVRAATSMSRISGNMVWRRVAFLVEEVARIVRSSAILDALRERTAGGLCRVEITSCS